MREKGNEEDMAKKQQKAGWMLILFINHNQSKTQKQRREKTASTDVPRIIKQQASRKIRK